jgi:hypothetical protein
MLVRAIEALDRHCDRWIQAGCGAIPPAKMLGARRTGLSLAAGTLQKAGFIRYRRGNNTGKPCGRNKEFSRL